MICNTLENLRKQMEDKRNTRTASEIQRFSKVLDTKIIHYYSKRRRSYAAYRGSHPDPCRRVCRQVHWRPRKYGWERILRVIRKTYDHSIE